MNPRLRRLATDQAKLATFFAGHPAVTVEPLGPAPADRYRVVYDVPSLRVDAQQRIVAFQPHVVTITLPPSYPRDKPYCVVDEPVFHPNFGNYVCIADYWSPSQSLADIVVQIGQMLQYQLYNTRSPLNAVAARWAVEHAASLPVARVELLPPEPEVRLHPATPGGGPPRTAATTATTTVDGS